MKKIKPCKFIKTAIFALIVLFSLSALSSASTLLDGTAMDNSFNIDDYVRDLFAIGQEDIATEINTQNIRTSVNTTTSIISGRISSIVAPRPVSSTPQNVSMNDSGNFKLPWTTASFTGLSAGDVPTKFGIWCNLSLTATDNSRDESESDATLGMGILGIDYQISPKILTGMALSYEYNDQDTKFNNGSIDQDGISLIPYFAYLINDMFSLDMTAGYAWLNVDQESDGSGAQSSFDSERWFISGNVHGYFNINEKTNLTITTGYTFSNEDQDKNSFNPEDTTELGTLSLGAEVAYLLNNKCEVYGSVAFTYDTTYEKPSTLSYDRDAFPLGGGVRFQPVKNFSIDVNVAAELGRDNQEQYTGMVNFRYDF